MVTLDILLTDEEKHYLLHAINGVNIGKQVIDLSVYELSIMALSLMRTEGIERAPKCVLSAAAITILTERAMKINKPIF